MVETSQKDNLQYTPEQGDIVYINFHPQRGHEQKGKRPALVVSNSLLSTKSSLAFFAPITNTYRPYPTHLQLDSRTTTTGSIMCEQLKALDYNTRGIVFIEKLPDDLLEIAKNYVHAIIE